MSSWFDDLKGKTVRTPGGALLPARKNLAFVGPRISVVDNPYTESTDVSMESPDGEFEVTSLFGRTGAVVGEYNDYQSSQVSFAPTADLSSTDAQAAIEEAYTVLDAEVGDVSRNWPIVDKAGTVTLGVGDLGTQIASSISTVHLKLDSGDGIPIGAVIPLMIRGYPAITRFTVEAINGATLQLPSGYAGELNGGYSYATLIKTAPDTYSLSGNLIPAPVKWYGQLGTGQNLSDGDLFSPTETDASDGWSLSGSVFTPPSLGIYQVAVNAKVFSPFDIGLSVGAKLIDGGGTTIVWAAEGTVTASSFVNYSLVASVRVESANPSFSLVAVGAQTVSDNGGDCMVFINKISELY